MGLAEKRATKAFQEGTFQELSKKINDVVGKEVEIDVQWETLAVDGMDHLYENSWPKVYFEPLIKALESICSDDMGKEAIADELQKIVIKNEVGIYSASSWSAFENKVVTLDHKPTTNIDQIDDRAKSLQSLLENNL